MTTIAFDGRILAADTQTTWSETKSFHKAEKIGKSVFKDYKNKEHVFYYGLAGSVGMHALVVEWFKTDGWRMLPQYVARTVRKEMDRVSANTLYDMLRHFISPEMDAEFSLIVVLPAKKPKLFIVQNHQYGFIEDSEPYAIGTGADFAMGAMLAGASAEKAVAVAGKIDVYTNERVQSIVCVKSK